MTHTEDTIKAVSMQYDDIMGELEYTRKILALYGIPDDIANRIVNGIMGKCKEHERDIIDMFDILDREGINTASIISEYLNTKD